MPGPLGTSGGGATGVTSVTAGNGITVTGTTTPTIAASIAAGTGVSIAGTTTLTVSATGVNSVSGGTGISVSGTTALTVSATGVNSIVGGTAISVSGTTTMTVNNTGVTSLAGTGISVSAATGSVTVTPTYAAPTALTIGGTVVTGAAASVANSAHVHAMPGSATAGASAVGDTAATGTATTVALSDHRHSREAFGTPVVVNGQTTSLATGSLTTLARADHVHTMSNVPVLLASTTLGSDTATVNLTGIPSGYTSIEILISVRSSAGAAQGAMDFGQIRFNSDTAANYGAATSAGSQITVIRPITAVNWLTAAWSSGKIIIWDYASTTKHKYIHYNTTYNNSTTAFNSVNYMDDAGVWKSTTAVTSVQFTLSSGANYITGSTFRIYGYP